MVSQTAEARLAALGIALPRPTVVPAGVRLPFAFVNLRGDRAFVSGHGPVDRDGRLCGPFGKVGRDVDEDAAYRAARLTGLSMLADLREALGSLDRITGWVRIFGMVNAAPGFDRLPAVINGCSDLVLEVFGESIGRHARSAVGMAELPWNIPVEIEAEVTIAAA
jgi:enamine deaminase RidA (YjgF/YER057c/UK114 family)